MGTLAVVCLAPTSFQSHISYPFQSIKQNAYLASGQTFGKYKDYQIPGSTDLTRIWLYEIGKKQERQEKQNQEFEVC